MILKKGIKIKADMLLIYNMSTRDSKYISDLRQANPKLKVMFVYHEPWFGFKSWLKDLITKRESIIDSIKTFGRYYFVKPILKKSDLILLPSKKAEEYYQKICIRYNQNYTLFPLIFTDEAENFSTEKKEYFSFISTASNSKNFNKFIEYIKYRSKIDTETKFQIATRTDITTYLDDTLQVLIKSGRLIVNHGHALSNAEINHAYAISNCTWMLYNRSTQSGVLCKSFMFCSPVIASNIGSFREFVNDSNGIILSNGYSMSDIDGAYNKIIANLFEYSDGARNTFLDSFYWKKFINEFEKLIN